MDVFITGGTGLIGSAVVTELLSHGHTVTGLARTATSAEKLRAHGASAVTGDLSSVDVIRDASRAADGVIHLAFANDFDSPEGLTRAIAEESAAITAIGESLRHSVKPFVVVSGTPWTPGRPATEDDPLPVDGPVGGRGRTVQATLDLAHEGVRVSAVRLPRTVHANGRGGFAGLLTQAAEASGVVRYPADGSQRWPAVHAQDAAALFRLALEKAPAGTAWHAVADEGDAVRDIAAVIGRRLRLPVESVDPDQFGALGPVFAMDQPATSEQTRREMGWRPVGPSLLEDLENLGAAEWGPGRGPGGPGITTKPSHDAKTHDRRKFFLARRAIWCHDYSGPAYP